MQKLGIRCVRRAVSGSASTDFGKVAYASLLLVLSCALSPAFAQASAGCTPAEGSGTSSSPYRIATLCELQGISLSPAAHYLLVDSIDASTATSFEPIASTATDGFSGSFMNASEHEISSLTISRSAESNVGLFSRLANGATLTGILLVGSRMTGLDNVGSLVGFSEGAIVDSSAMGSVSGRNRVGGLVGHSRGDISGSYVKGSVSGDDYVGGLVGSGEGGISGSYVAGSVSGDDVVGGLVGRQEFGSTISGSYATGSVSGRNYVGGLIGNGYAGIDYSYATGVVSGRDHVGGLVGYQGFTPYIRNSYATGSVSGNDVVGGLVGYLESFSSMENSYATGSVFGQGNFVGGLVGRKFRFDPMFDGTVSDSYYAAGRRNNGSGEERTFAQLRCPMTAGATCPSGSQESALTYEGWDTDVWDFGSAMNLPQLSSNRNLELNQKPYIEGSSELVVGTGFTGITRFPLEADYPGSSDGSVVLTWSLLFDASSTPGGSFYFELEDGTTSTEANGSSATLAVVDDDRITAGRGFYIVLKNNVSANDDRIRVRTEEAPYIFRNDTVSARIGSTATFSFSVGYEGTPVKPVALTWSLSGVPSTLNTLVYFDLGDGTTSTTFADPGRLVADASVVTLVVVGNEELAGKSFYVELKNDISDNDDRILIRTESGQPYILLDDDIDPATTRETTTFSFSVGYTGSSEPVTLTWSLDVPPSLDGLAYFDLGGTTTSTTFTDRGVRTADSSPVMLVVEGNEDLAGNGFYVELKNNISDSVDRIPVRIAGAIPLVVGGSEQTGTIWAGSLSNFLNFRAIDQDSPDSGGAGLSWGFSSAGISDGSTVRFSGTTRGGTVGVEVVRPSLDFYGAGSFVLEVTSLAGVKTAFTVTIETVCSLVPGDDLMAEQAGAGTSDNPYQIRRLCQLQDISSSPTAHYVLEDDIDASETRDWNDGAGFEPIAIGDTTGFSGSFVNRGDFEIRSLSISRGDADSVGLFSELAGGAEIRGIKLVGSRTAGGEGVGSIAGLNGVGLIVGCSATGSVFGEGNVGGLVGDDFGFIRDSFAASTVTGTGNGILGLNYAVGGLAGYSFSSIRNSYAMGSVTGGNRVGGLVGHQAGGTIENSYAAGSVSGQIDVGGLVGQSAANTDVFLPANINNSYATGSVSGVENVGGFVGRSAENTDVGIAASINNSYATGLVSGQKNVGGFVGYQESNSSIRDSYATGSVSGQTDIGGLVGYSKGSISNTFAVSTVSTVTGTTTRIGGLVGFSENSIVSSYYTGQDQGKGWGELRTLGQLRCPTTPDAVCMLQTDQVTYAGWDSKFWDFGGTDGLPTLRREEDGGEPIAITRPLRVKVYLGGAVR